MMQPSTTTYQEGFVKTEQRTVHIITCDACGATFEAAHYPDPGKAWDAAQDYGFRYWPMVGKVLCDLCTNKAIEAAKDRLRDAEIEQAHRGGYRPTRDEDDDDNGRYIFPARVITRTYREPEA